MATGTVFGVEGFGGFRVRGSRVEGFPDLGFRAQGLGIRV